MSLTDNGVKVDWRSLDSLSALIYSDSQRAIAGAASIEIDKADTTILLIEYAGYQPQYDGLARLIIRCLYKGAEKTFDAPVCDFVSTTAEATGITVINDPELDVHLTVNEVSTSVLDAAIAAAFDGASKANTAAVKAVEAGIKAEEAGIKAEEAAQTLAPRLEQLEERLTDELARKQDTIPDLDTIRDGASKGATALQDYTESDPVYMADKPSLATKTELATKQDTISDLETIREGAALGKTALQEHQDISGLATKEEVAGKQDIISDLDSIREGASKGATALQSYTESDPIYTADKPKLALKSEIPDISGKADKTAIVTETEGNASYTILPNVLTKLGTLASSVTLSLDTSKEESGVTNVYDIIFVTPADAPSITWPEGISWVGGSAPTIAGGKTYEVSIMDNLATYGEF